MERNIEKAWEIASRPLKKGARKKSDHVQIYITKQDRISYDTLLQQKYPKCTFLELEEEAIGGCKCFNPETNMLVDHTLQGEIQEQIQALEGSGSI